MKYHELTTIEPQAFQVKERLPRYFVKGQPQHVIQRGNNRDVIFVCDEDYLFYQECLRNAAVKLELKIHTYVLMTNHVHLLASPMCKNSIPKTMQSVGRRYVQYFNTRYRRTGTLWEGRYKATVIDSEQYFLTCSRYIELNPVRAGMVSSPDEYPWSSYAANALGKQNLLLSPYPLYIALGATVTTRCNAYRALFKNTLPKTELDAIRESTNKGWALGDTKFRGRIEALTQRRVEPLLKGRPKNVDDENRV